MMENNTGPAAGLRVLDLGTFIAAPFAATVLGEFGAEVIKVEMPESGDPLRRFGTPAPDGNTLCWHSEARNKKSLTLDIRTREGRDILLRLAAQSDVFCESFRPATLERWDLGPEILHRANSRLVILRVSGFGQTGPMRTRPSFARIAHAFGGLAHLTGMPGGPPLTPGSTSLADYMTGLYGAIGILMALRARDAVGGQVIDLALYESVLRVLDDLAPSYAQDGTVRDRLGMGTSNACPHGHFQSSDGKWIALACTSDKIFARFMTTIGRPDLARSHSTVVLRLRDRDVIDGAVSSWMADLTAAEILERCVGASVPCAPINTIANIFADPHIAARENIVHVATHSGAPCAVPNVLPRLSKTPGRIDALGPALGAHTVEILQTLLGLSAADCDLLRTKRII